MAKSWVLILWEKGGEQLPGVGLSPISLHGNAAGISLQIKGRGIHQGAGLTKILCSPAHRLKHYTSLFLGELQGVQLCLEGRFDRTCVIVWKVPREQ